MSNSNNNNLILPNKDLGEVEPVEILIALHKRITLAEQRFISAINQLSNLVVEIEMMKERIEKIEERFVKIDQENADGK